SGVVVWKADFFNEAAPVPEEVKPVAGPKSLEPSIGPPLYVPVVPSAGAVPRKAERVNVPIVLPECRLTVMEKQDVPSQRDGIVPFIGGEIEAGQEPPADQVIRVTLGGQEQRFRKLKEGDTVRAGQLLAYLDDQLSRDDWAIKKARVAAARADMDAAIKSCDEA